jgi:hypothetical protein
MLPSSFCSGYFCDRVLFFAHLARTVILLFMLPIVGGMTGMHHHAQFFILRVGLMNFFLPGIAWNHDPLQNWDDGAQLLVELGVSQTFCLGLALKHNPFYRCFLSSS